MYDSFLRYWRILEAIIRIKVDLVEAGLASGLPCAADRHSRGQASCLGRRDSLGTFVFQQLCHYSLRYSTEPPLFLRRVQLISRARSVGVRCAGQLVASNGSAAA